MKNLISISGRIGAGKDLVGTIIQYLIWKNKVEKQETDLANYTLEDFQRVGNNLSNWKIKKFADKLKDIVCILLGCSRADLEDREFKEKELGEEWWYWKNSLGKLVPYLDNPDYNGDLIKLSPRLMMQLIGTECFRNIIHPNTWVNALFSEYRESKPPKVLTRLGINDLYGHSSCIDCKKPYSGYKTQFICNDCYDNHNWFPNWIITDTRYNNELEAVKKRGGITINIKRKFYKSTMDILKPYSDFFNHGTPIPKIHESETALNSAQFDYTIENDSDIDSLIEKVKVILIKEGIIENGL